MTYQQLQDRKNELIRKALEGSVFIADSSVTAIDVLTIATGTGATAVVDLKPLPVGYDDLGWLSEEGIGFGREIATSDISAFGSTQPVRSDVTTDTTTMTCTALETRASVLRVETGADIAALTPNADTGEVSLAKPARPASRYYRVLALAVDVDDDGNEIYIARFLPRAKVTSFGDKSFTSGDTPVQAGFTFQAYEDSELGYSDKLFWGGPGWKNLLEKMGLEA